MSDKFTITLVNEAELQARLANVVQGLQYPANLMERIGALMESRVNLRFETKVAPDGTPWLPLDPSTVSRYAKVYKGNVPGSLLQRTRHMRNSLTHNAGDDWVEVGFSDVLASFHETGTRRGLPRRQLLSDDPIAGTLAEADRQAVLDEVQDFLAGLL